MLMPVVLVLAACQAAATPSPAPAATSAPQATSVPPATTAPMPATPSEAAINVATDAKLGSILVDGQGMTLYMFTKDEADKSNCTGKCIENWPALVTQGKPELGEGVDASLIGTAPLPDGSMIVTYNHMPLYYWIKDTKPGDTTGQGNNDVWYVVAPDGNPVGFANTNANDNGNTNSNSNENSNDNSGNDNGGG